MATIHHHNKFHGINTLDDMPFTPLQNQYIFLVPNIILGDLQRKIAARYDDLAAKTEDTACFTHQTILISGYNIDIYSMGIHYDFFITTPNRADYNTAQEKRIPFKCSLEIQDKENIRMIEDLFLQDTIPKYYSFRHCLEIGVIKAGDILGYHNDNDDFKFLEGFIDNKDGTLRINIGKEYVDSFTDFCAAGQTYCGGSSELNFMYVQQGCHKYRWRKFMEILIWENTRFLKPETQIALFSRAIGISDHTISKLLT